MLSKKPCDGRKSTGVFQGSQYRGAVRRYTEPMKQVLPAENA